MLTSLNLRPSGLTGAAAGRRRPIAVLVLLAATAVAVGFGVVRLNAGSSAMMPLSPAIEAAWGIRVSQVAVTADGGLVDFRFLVLDSDKAGLLMTDPSHLPILRIEGSDGVVFSAASMAAKHDLGVGRTYFILYRNAGGAIHRGTSVTVVFADGLELGHVVAQ